MYFIAGFGLLMMCLSLLMIVSPNHYSQGILNFSNKVYFHWFEVISRLLIGFALVIFNQAASYPLLILSIGCVLVAVGCGLVITGETKHREFAVWSAHKFKVIFRPAGVGSFILGLVLIYISNIGQIIK